MNRSKMFYGWRIVIGAVFVLAVTAPASVALANVYQNAVTDALGISNSMFSISNTLILGVSVLFSSFISGKLAKNFKKFFITMSVIYGLAYMGFGLITNVWMFYFLSIIVGFGFVSTSVMPMSILISNWFEEKRGLALSIALSGLGLGGVIWSPIVTYMINNIHWRVSYMVYGFIMMVVCLLVGIFIFAGKPQDMGLQPLGSDVENSFQKQVDHARVPFTLQESMTKPFFWLLLNGAVFIGLANNGGLGQFPPFMQQMHGASQGAVIISIYSGVGIFGKLGMGVLVDKFGPIFGIIYSATFMAIAFFLAGFTTSYTSAIILATLFGLATANGSVLPPLFIGSIFPPATYAKVFGLINQFLALGMMFGSLLAAGIGEATSYTVAWYVFAIISALIIVFWLAAYAIAKKDFQSPQSDI